MFENLKLPKIKIDLDWSGFLESLNFGDEFAEFADRVLDTWWANAPANIQPLRGDVELGDLFTLLRDEGLPLAPALRPQIVRELVEAGDEQERRRILEERAPDVIEDCGRALNSLAASQVVGPYAVFGLDGVTAFKAGAFRSTQALASAVTTSVLDEIEDSFDEAWNAARKRGRSKDYPQELKDSPTYELWVLAPLWHAYESARDGDLPGKWARNSSIHLASDVHYNTANALISMLFVIALLDYINTRFVNVGDDKDSEGQQPDA